MKLVIKHPTATDLNFKSHLYKLQSDRLDFGAFEEMFDSEDDAGMPNEPRFEDEWSRCEGLYMHANQTAVFVAVADLMQFVDRLSSRIKIFISYEVKCETTTVKMILDAGEILVDHSTIHSVNSEIGTKSLEIYRDLLAVTCSSTVISLTLKFDRSPNIKFQDFLTAKLRFTKCVCNVEAISQNDLLTINDTEMMDIDDHDANLVESNFFYCNENYFKGVLVRLGLKKSINVELKVYFRSNHQIVTFAKAILQSYAERCSIDVKKNVRGNNFDSDSVIAHDVVNSDN